MLQICKALFEKWNKDEIQYCHWKSNEHLMEGLDGLTDLDVYVAPADQIPAEASLKELRYVKFVPQKGARYPMVDEWIGFDYDTGKLVHVHLHYQIITGTKFNKEYIFPLDELMMNTRVQDDQTGVYLIAPNLEIIVLYARIALKAKDKNNICPSADDQREIDYLKQRLDAAQLEMFCNELLQHSAEEFCSMIRKDRLSAQQWHQLYQMVVAWLKPYKKYAAPIVQLRYKYFRLRNIRNAVCNRRLHTNYIGRKTLPGKGLSICFLGADGSGKSTVSMEIEKWLTWKVEAKRFYLGSGDHYNSLTKRLLKVVSRSRQIERKVKNTDKAAQPEQKAEASKKPEKISIKRRILRFGHAVLQSTYLKEIAVRAYGEIKKACKYADQGAIAIYDRFPQNQFTNLYDGPKITVRYLTDKKGSAYIRFMAWLEERAIAKAQNYQPTLVFKLLLPPEESVRRKPDHTLEEVAPKAEITPKLVFANSKVYDIDATQEYAAEILEIKRLLWNEVAGK